jgi:hypothetical protein
MRAVLVVDRTFGRVEGPMLSRLEIGLADEGYRVVHAVPVASMGAFEHGGVYSTSIGYVDTGLPFTLRSRVAALVESLRALAEKQGDRGPVNVVHACGKGAWPVGLELARQTGAAAVLELERASLLGAAAAMSSQEASEYPTGNLRLTPMICVPDELLRSELLRKSARARTSLARWGVRVPPGRHARTGAPAVVMLVERGDSRAAIAVLEALAAIAKEFPDLMVFLDVGDGKNAGVWRAARRLGLLERLSMVPELEARREPALQMDAVLMPDAAGVSHSFVLDAMAAGLSVLAAPDPLVETLIDGRTARLVVSPTKAEWERAIRETVLDAERWSLLGASARDYIRTSRTVSGHIGAVLEAYSQAQHLHEADLARQKAVA